jgi:ribonuclease Z
MVSNLSIRIRPPAPPAKNPNAIANDYFHPLLEKMTPTDESIPIELSPETQQKFAEAQQLTAKIQQSILKQGVTKPGDDVVVVPLGTGSAVPGKYRTVSSTLIQIPNWGNVLLDAGEGTYYQLARHFGEEGVGDVLRDLRCLFVSHAHADHHMGVGMLLRKRLEVRSLALVLWRDELTDNFCV